MLNTNNNISFGGKIQISKFKDASHYQKTLINTSLTDDRLFKLTANSIVKSGENLKPIENRFAAPFARLIEMITGQKITLGEQRKYMSCDNSRIIFQDKFPEDNGESVLIDLDKRLDLD